MSRFTGEARLWEVLDSPKVRLIIERHAPGLLGHADIAALSEVPLQALAAFGSDLAEIARAEFSGRDAVAAPARLGEFELEYGQTDSVPLLLVSEVRVGDLVADRNTTEGLTLTGWNLAERTPGG